MDKITPERLVFDSKRSMITLISYPDFFIHRHLTSALIPFKFFFILFVKYKPCAANNKHKKKITIQLGASLKLCRVIVVVVVVCRKLCVFMNFRVSFLFLNV